MASITISSATISINGDPQRDGVGETTAAVSYSCSATFTLSENSEDTYSKTVYSWDGDATYTWEIESSTFSDSSGTGRVTQLSRGSENIISGSVTVTCSEKASSYSREGIYSDPEPIYGEPDPKTGEKPIIGYTEPELIGYTEWTLASESSSDVSGTADTNSITVYTRPGNFIEYASFTGGVNGTIITSSSGLTATKVANWCTHCNKFAHWYNQNNIDKAGNNCQATTNDIIRATWYNNCVDACADTTVAPIKVTGGVNGTIITPEVFANLGNAISKTGEVLS